MYVRAELPARETKRNVRFVHFATSCPLEACPAQTLRDPAAGALRRARLRLWSAGGLADEAGLLPVPPERRNARQRRPAAGANPPCLAPWPTSITALLFFNHLLYRSPKRLFSYLFLAYPVLLA